MHFTCLCFVFVTFDTFGLRGYFLLCCGLSKYIYIYIHIIYLNILCLGLGNMAIFQVKFTTARFTLFLARVSTFLHNFFLGRRARSPPQGPYAHNPSATRHEPPPWGCGIAIENSGCLFKTARIYTAGDLITLNEVIALYGL